MDKRLSQPVNGPTNSESLSQAVIRFGSVIGLQDEMEEKYRSLHADVWPDVQSRLLQSNIRNYSIFVGEIDGKQYLFSYFEYVGEDLENDMKAMADDPATQSWWQQTDPCQFRIAGTPEGENWKPMERVCFLP